MEQSINKSTHIKLDDIEQLKEILADYRAVRNFNVDTYIDKKTDAINNFFKDNNLDAAVIGISGGVDSAVVYKLLTAASKKKNSPIKKIIGLLMPIYCSGTSGQDAALKRGLEVVNKNKIESYYINDLSDACNAYINQVDNSTGVTMWSIGQLASIVRTPNLYFRAAQLQVLNYKSIVVGTTNRCEGSYIGLFGKFSDGANDLQPIADIHKSEVYQVAHKLSVPESIINEKPRGDVWDNKSDEELIGAPYDFLEMYLLFLSKSIRDNISTERHTMHIEIMSTMQNSENYKIAQKWMKNIDTIHEKNKHKYQVGTPSHFIDVMERKVLGGW